MPPAPAIASADAHRWLPQPAAGKIDRSGLAGVGYDGRQPGRRQKETLAMCNNLRLTGENPSPELLEQYPNWEYALDEEAVDGQDETTLRPAEDQSIIGEYVCRTAGTAWLNNGQDCPAIIEMVDGVGGVEIYLEGQWYRIVRWVDRFDQFERWEPFVEDWLPEEERCPSFSLADVTVIPLRFASRLPYYRTASPIRTKIVTDGGEETWS